jgi:LysM repeat protein
MDNKSLSKINKYLCLVITISMALLFVSCSGDVKRLGDSERFLYKNVTNTPSSYKGKNSYKENEFKTNNITSQVKLIPENITIIAKQGDDIHSISREHGVSVEAIARQNFINYPYELRIGQKITFTTNNDNLNSSVVRDTEETIVTIDDVYVVKSGDSLSLISSKYNINIKSLSVLNNITDPSRIYVGQRLTIPRENKFYDSVKKESTTIALPQEAQDLKISDNRQSIDREINFRWPVKGRVIYHFSDLVNGEINKGISISVPVGSSIKAAEDGVVLFSGIEDGLGNVILVKHAYGWITSYRHLSERLVKRGDVVSRGQVIAKSGKSDDLDTPQLYFSVKKDSVNVNPEDHLPN